MRSNNLFRKNKRKNSELKITRSESLRNAIIKAELKDESGYRADNTTALVCATIKFLPLRGSSYVYTKILRKDYILYDLPKSFCK